MSDDILDALKPFAHLGLAFGDAHDPASDSPWEGAPDAAELQVGATHLLGWTVTVGQLRAAARAYYTARPDE